MNEANNTQNANTSYGRSRAGRIGLFAGAAVAGLLAIGALGLGGLALWGDSQKDADGYLSTGSERFEASTSALTAESIDIDLDEAEWLMDSGDFGKVRLEVSPQTDEPVFVGIAPTADVDAYLRDVAHTRVTDIDWPQFEATYSPQDGQRPPAAPAGQGIWKASAHGAGPQTLNWDVEDGDWSVVVMNADGSPGVEADISTGAKLPFLDELGWSSLGGGGILVLVTAGLVALALRPPRNRPGAGSPAAIAHPAPAA